MHNRIQLTGDKDVFRDILPDKREPVIPGQMGNIGGIAGHEIVQSDHFMTFRQEPIAEMGA